MLISIRKFIIGTVVPGNLYPITLGAPAMVMNPLHETVSHAGLSTQRKLPSVFIKNFIFVIDDQAIIIDDMWT